MRVSVTWFPQSSGTTGPVELPATASALGLLEALGEAPDGVLVVRDGTPIPLDAPLRDGDGVRLVRTVSGG